MSWPLDNVRSRYDRAKCAEKWLREQAGDDEAGEIGFEVRALLQPSPPAASKPAECLCGLYPLDDQHSLGSQICPVHGEPAASKPRYEQVERPCHMCGALTLERCGDLPTCTEHMPVTPAVQSGGIVQFPIVCPNGHKGPLRLVNVPEPGESGLPWATFICDECAASGTSVQWPAPERR
jgi:hypothetical protein